MSSNHAKEFHQWRAEYDAMMSGDVCDIMDMGDAKKAIWAWAAALIAGGYETHLYRTWDNYFFNLGVK